MFANHMATIRWKIVRRLAPHKAIVYRQNRYEITDTTAMTSFVSNQNDSNSLQHFQTNYDKIGIGQIIVRFPAHPVAYKFSFHSNAKQWQLPHFAIACMRAPLFCRKKGFSLFRIQVVQNYDIKIIAGKKSLSKIVQI